MLAAPVRPLALIPSLDEIVRNPRMAAELPQLAIRDLLRRCAAAQSILVVELKSEDNGRVADHFLPDSNIRLLTAKKVSELWSLPESWIRDQARRGKLPSVKRGHYVRFRLSDLERFLSEEPEREVSNGNATSEASGSTPHKNGIHRV
jgi:Helix-turn-helix domain